MGGGIGIIGLGSMGTMLVEGWLRSGVRSDRLSIFSRTPARYEGLCSQHPEVRVAPSIPDLVQQVDIVFLAVPPSEVKGVLENITPAGNQELVVVSLAASVTLACLQSVIGSRVCRVIPSITAEVDEGVFLFCPGALGKEEVNLVVDCLSEIGAVYPIPEELIEVYTDLTSCSPGIFSAVFQLFLTSAHRFGDLDPALARQLFVHSLSGLTKLYRERNLDFDQVVSRVARKGGVTEVGIQVVNQSLPGAFDEVFEKTLEDHREKKRKMLKTYGL